MKTKINYFNPKIEINQLLKAKKIVKGNSKKFVLRIKDLDNEIKINCTSSMKSAETMIYLKYRVNSISPEIRLQVKLIELKTNLKNDGKQFLFLCPYSQTPCKVLHLCEKTHLFVSRDSYRWLSENLEKIAIELPIVSNEKLKELKEKQNALVAAKNTELNERAKQFIAGLQKQT